MSIVSELLIILRGQDQASGAISKVNSETKLLKDAMQGLGIGATLAYGSAGLALGAFVKMGVSELVEAEKVNAQLNATLKSTGQVAGVTAASADVLASRLSNLASVDDEVVKSGEAVLLTFTNIRNVGADKIFDDAMVAALDLSRAFGQDLQSSVIQVGKALQDPIAGVTALRRVGVQLSQEQEDQIRKFVEMNDIMSAQKVILGELQKEVGGSAEAYGNTFAGQVEHAKIELANFSAEITGRTVVGLTILFGWLGKVDDKLGDIIDRVDVFGLLSDGADEQARAAQVEAETWAWVNRELGNVETKAHSVKASIVEIDGAMATFGPFPPVFGPTIEQAELLKKTAEEASRALYDALNTPSPERKIRSALLDQAEFNAARLQQQVDAGMGDVASGVGDATKSEYLDWLKNDFIPAQEEWLKLDQLKTDANVSSAEAMKAMGQDERDFARFQRGELLPNQKEFNSSVYTTKDALDNTAAALRYVKTESPAGLKIGLDGPTPTVPTKAAQIRQGFRGETPATFGVGLTDPLPKVPTMAARLRSGFRGETPATFGVGLTDPLPKVPTMAARLRSGFRGETPATFGVGLTDPLPKVPTMAARLRSGFRGETPATFGVGLDAPPDPTISATVAAIKSKILYYWSLLWGGGAGVTFNPSELQTAQVIAAAGFPGFRPHNEQGVAAGTSPFGIAPSVLPGGISGITYNQTFNNTSNISGVFLGSPDQIASFVRDYIMPEIRREWGR